MRRVLSLIAAAAALLAATPVHAQQVAADYPNKPVKVVVTVPPACGVDTVSDPRVVLPSSFGELLLRSYRGRNLGQRLAPWLKLRPRDLEPILPAVIEPRTGLSMGEHCELMAKTWKISREEQDRVALDSQLKTIGDAERSLTAAMVQTGKSGAEAVNAWAEPRKVEVERIRAAIHQIAASGLTISKLSVAASLLGDLVKG